MKKLKDCRITISWNRDHDCYEAITQEYPDLLALGDTRVDALKAAEIAIEAYLECREIQELDGCEGSRKK